MLVVVGVGGVVCVVCGGSNGVSVGAWVPMGFQLVHGFQWGFSWCMGSNGVSVDPTFLYGVGGVGGGCWCWWFYIAVAIVPITAII